MRAEPGRADSLTLAEIVARLGGRVAGNPACTVSQVGSLERATADQITFLSGPRHKAKLAATPLGQPRHQRQRSARAYQIANKLSATFRQGLLLYEIRRALFKPQRPHIGEPIPASEVDKWPGNPRGFLAWLRDHTLSLGTTKPD